MDLKEDKEDEGSKVGWELLENKVPRVKKDLKALLEQLDLLALMVDKVNQGLMAKMD